MFESAIEQAVLLGICEEGDVVRILQAFLFALPRPVLPYDQAAMYRELVGIGE